MATKKVNRRASAQEAHEEARRAFEVMAPRFGAIPAGEVQAVKVDIARAAGIVLASEGRLRELLPQMEALPGFDARCVTELREVALAAWYVHVAIAPAEMDEGRIKRLVAEATALRRALLFQAQALAEWGIVDAERLAAVRPGRGTADLANGMVALSHLFRSAWERIGGRTPVTEEALDRAADLGTELLHALGARVVDHPTGIGGRDPVEQRSRAFTLLARTYDEVRRAVRYLRWHDRDADDLAPSLYAGSRGGRRATTRERDEAGSSAPEVQDRSGAPRSAEPFVPVGSTGEVGLAGPARGPAANGASSPVSSPA